MDRVGADGDGIALHADGAPLYLPNTLPGELVAARPVARRGEGWAATADLIEPSAERIIPPCPHFGPCGGCTLQHWRKDGYERWKVAQVTDALRRAGATDVPHSPLAVTPPGGRWRMDLAMRREGGAVRIGLHRRRSREIVDMHACPVLHPALFELVQALRPVLAGLSALRREGSAVVNLLDSGPDLLLRTDAELSAADRIALAGLARAKGMARVFWARGNGAPEPACVLRPATLSLARVATTPPPGVFLQASREGMAAIEAAVLAGLPRAMPPRARVIELFAGCGGITHALSQRARVAAFEGDKANVAALRRAANPRVAATLRDLARQPLSELELRGAASVVLDPPYAGAAAQMPALARARLTCVIYVSCNPQILARDARMLLQAGYRAAQVTPVDQFLWSARVESVVVFSATPHAS